MQPYSRMLFKPVAYLVIIPETLMHTYLLNLFITTTTSAAARLGILCGKLFVIRFCIALVTCPS